MSFSRFQRLAGGFRQQACAQCAIGIQATGSIRSKSILLAHANTKIAGSLKFLARPLAHQVDDAAHFTAIIKQPTGAAHDFQTIKGDQLRLSAVDALHLRWQTINIIFVIFDTFADRQAPVRSFLG